MNGQLDIFCDDVIFCDPLFLHRAEDIARTKPILSEAEAQDMVASWIRHAQGVNNLANKTILSLFDKSGIWSTPYVLAGYDVIQLDVQNGVDIMELTMDGMSDAGIDEVDGILAACPCTDFSVSGNQWWDEKDTDGRTDESIALVHQTMEIVEYYQPEFWCLENPIGRIRRLCGLPKPRMFFHPHHYGDPYTKKTQLFGVFNENLPQANVHPRLGSYIHNLWGTNPEHKELRSQTPEGFAFAFFMANQI